MFSAIYFSYKSGLYFLVRSNDFSCLHFSILPVSYTHLDGESALDNLSTFKPNLILLDLMLPGIDGYQVCREIRKNNNTPIIMLSAKGETFDKVLGLELGADVYKRQAILHSGVTLSFDGVMIFISLAYP